MRSDLLRAFLKECGPSFPIFILRSKSPLMAASKPNVLTASFIVAGNDLDERAALSICRILKGVTDQTDATILRATGALNYNQLQVKHYFLDVVGSAKLYDVIMIHTYIRSYEDDVLSIELRAVRKRGRREQPLLNGSFVYTVRREVPICYSLS